MGFKEAMEDNIPHVRANGFDAYYPPCHVCGDGVKSWNYIRGVQYTCPECKQFIQIQKLENRSNVQVEKRKMQLKRAVSRITKVANIENYKTIIIDFENHIADKDWFQSTEEVMVGLQLRKKKIKFITQYKVGPYYCDFYLPKLKVVLEIDGELYHGKDKKEYQYNRDRFIEEKLGNGIVVIRIKTTHINTNVTRITNAIYALKRLKKLDS